ncbi:hypothetical protein ACPZ19_46275 [Amycolatopsis lurida]
MNANSLDPQWLRAWATDITAHLQSVLAAFDTYYPFPPGENEVILTSHDHRDGLETLRTHPVPPDLITFYGTINEVVMADIGNAYFIHAPTLVLAHLASYSLLHNAADGIIFATDGGGTFFVIGQDGTIHRSLTASTETGFEPIATDLRDFLEQLRDTVTRFVTTKEPGDL